MDKESALELIGILKMMNDNIVRCTNEVCKNAKKIESAEAKLERLINDQKYPESKPVEDVVEWL